MDGLESEAEILDPHLKLSAVDHFLGPELSNRMASGLSRMGMDLGQVIAQQPRRSPV